MSTLNPPKRISKRHELREDKVVTFYARAWEYFDNNRTLVYGIVAAVVVVVLAIVGWALFQNNQSKVAEEALGQILPTYEAKSYREALDGTADRKGLLAIAEDYGSTDSGNLARFYAADALFNLGEYDQALEFYEDFDKQGDIFGAGALAGEAAIYENKEDYDRAGDLYRQAAMHYENDLTSPQYLISAGRDYELAGEYDKAIDAYQTITDRFPDSSVASGVDFYVARAQAKKAS